MAERLARAFLDAAHEGFVAVDGAGRIVGWNAEAERMLGWRREEVLGLPLAETVIPEHLRARHAERVAALGAGQHGVGPQRECFFRHREGRDLPVAITPAVAELAEGLVVAFFLQDVASRARLAAIVDSTHDAILSKNLDGIVTSWNQGAERLYGYGADEAVGRHVSFLVPPERAGEELRVLERIRRREPMRNHETVRCRRDGSRVEVSLTASPVLGPGGEVVGASVIARDITSEKRRHERAVHAAAHDDVTGLPNRRQFVERLGEAMTRPEPLEVAIVSIDRFRELRDTLGHDRADVLVRELGARLRRSLPAAALVARLTEDEFAVLAPVARGPSGKALVELLQMVLRPSVMLGELAVAIDVNVGIARHPDHAHEPGLLVRRATRALRAAKRERTGHRVYDEGVGDVGPERLALAGELSRAFERGEIAFEYQPQLDLRTGELVGAEALVRWHHPVRGPISPGEFLPLIEQGPLVRRLALTALDHALRAARSWRDVGLAPTVAVNLSVLNLLDLGIAHDVARLLAERGVPPHGLKLEVTEDALMFDPARSTAVLGGLHAMGVALSVDDFGTGYSSLSYLQRLPLDEIKIDRCFVRQIVTNPRDAAIVRSVADLAGHLGLRLVAEGVETPEQREAVLDAGCVVGQGFLLGRPMPAEALLDWAVRRRRGARAAVGATQV